MASSPFHVLVVGAGIAGPVAAYWLLQAGCRVTIVERAAALRHAGQGVDLRGAGRTVVERMGVEAAILAKTTHEEGMVFVDANDQVQATFPAPDPAAPAASKGPAFTSDIEIMRGDLSRILWEALAGRVTTRFETTVTRVHETEAGIDVWLETAATIAPTVEAPEHFDFLIAADGLFSPTRGLALGAALADIDPIHHIHLFGAYYTLPRQPHDSGMARWFNAPGRRSVMLRPVSSTLCSAYLMTVATPENEPALRALRAASPDEQRTELRRLFGDLGWETPRVLAAMDAAEDFYMQEIAQARLPTWSSPGGRAACIGDAACCPSAVTGMGTTLATLSAYVLAGEIATAVRDADGGPVDTKAACARYEKQLRPFVERAQRLMPGVPHIANPETEWGIWIFRKIVGLVSWSGVAALAGKYLDPPADWAEMPEYKVEPSVICA